MLLLTVSAGKGKDMAWSLPTPAAPRGIYLLAEADAAPRVLIELVAIQQQRQDVHRHGAVRV